MAPNHEAGVAETDLQATISLSELPAPKVVLDAKEASYAALKAACGLTPEEVAAMRRAFAQVTCADKPKEEADKVVSTLSIALFELLFERHPQLLDMFPFKGSNNKPITARMEGHAVKVVTTLGAVLGMLDDFPTLHQTTLALATRHIKYKVVLEHYDMVLGVVAEFLQAGMTAHGLWDDVQASAWPKLVALIKGVAATVYAPQA